MKSIRIAAWALLLVFALSGCNRKSQLVYLRNLQMAETFNAQTPPTYHLAKGDVLYIQLITTNPEVSASFNNPSGVQNMGQIRDEASLYLSGYTINNQGAVELPFVGAVEVMGLTIDEARSAIQAEAANFFEDATIKLRYGSFKITVLGEVRRPGNQMNYNDNINIFEALAQAGDITENGNRNNILVLRPTPEGGKTFRLSLADKTILGSEAFYLLPNDVVIVEPIANKAFMMNIPYITLLFSTISTAILLIKFLF